MEQMLRQVAEVLRNTTNAVAFTGAGVSTESGIPDFRSSTGIYTQTDNAMELLSLTTFHARPKEFYQFFKDSFLRYGDAQPNAAHKVLAKWQREGRLTTLVTQNVDGLHQAAGSPRVLELHGHTRSVVCLSCDRGFPMSDFVIDSETYPRCPECDKPLKPRVVLFEEPLPQDVLGEAFAAAQAAEVLIVVGTSLTVSPANYLVDYRNPRGKLVIINLDPTPYDRYADWVIHGKAGETLTRLDELLS